MKRGLLTQQFNNLAIYHMLTLNKAAAEVMLTFAVSTATDITGFGLLGHLHEITAASGVDAEIYAAEVPILPGAEEMAAAGVIPGGTLNNLEYAERFVLWDEKISYIKKVLLSDAQTSGGLLVCMPEGFASEFVKKLKDSGVEGVVVGKILSNGKGLIQVK
jgi:selenophosphate synthase